MKRFIIDIICGCVVFCIAWFAGEVAIEKLKVKNNYSYKYNYVKNNPGIKILLTGDSHFENGLNPYLLGDSVFNFAISGRSNWRGIEAQLAEELYPTMPNLQVVMMPLGCYNIYCSYHCRELREIDEEYLYKYSKFMHVYYDRFPGSIYYRSALINNKMGVKYWQDEEVDELGYAKEEGQLDDWKNQHNVDSAWGEGEIAELCYKENVHYLTQIARVCHEHGIRFIIVTAPCANCYIERLPPKASRDLLSAIDSVRAYYPVEYINYIADPEFRADSIYYNASHLNSIGADMFARRLKADFGL